MFEEFENLDEGFATLCEHVFPSNYVGQTWIFLQKF